MKRKGAGAVKRSKGPTKAQNGGNATDRRKERRHSLERRDGGDPPRAPPRMRLRGVTVDTGFLMALERSKQRAIELTALAGTRGIRFTLPVAVLAEWWRDGKHQGHYLKAFAIGT